jgi:hypothetical protein
MSAPSPLPTEPEILAEAFVRMFEQQPELLEMIKRAIVRRQDAATAAVAGARIDKGSKAAEIRAILAALMLAKYHNKELWMSQLERHKQEDPELVEKIRTRLEREISQTSEETYARSNNVVDGGGDR